MQPHGAVSAPLCCMTCAAETFLPAETGAGMDRPALRRGSEDPWPWLGRAGQLLCCPGVAAPPASRACPALGVSPRFAKSSGNKDAAGTSVVRTGGCLRGVAGAPSSAMPLTALRFITNANTLPLFSAFHPQGSQGTLHPLTSCYGCYL